jgi:general secretion pathway protein E
MPLVNCVQSFSASSFNLLATEVSFIPPASSLSFSPVRLISLVVWVYFCLYLIQCVQFSSLVPEKYKSIAYVITLLTGPTLLLILFVVDSIKKSRKSNISAFVTLTQQLKKTITKIRSRSHIHRKDDQTIKLLDTSGRNINEIYGHGDRKRPDSHILNLTEKIIADALERRASDILIDPKDESTYTIRLRIDGVLRMVQKLKTETCKAVVNSIKAVSSMDISEKRRPQDGAFSAKKAGQTTSFRVASAGVINGEKLSVRILNQDASNFTLTDVGLTKKQYSLIHGAVKKPSGMILLCGPTGSGKTTTMYAMLNEIDRFTRNVITVEDPIEAVLPTASQIEINPKADITFAKTLRSVLRQDPDVICVGEIRDEETAEIALRAAQTGHLVLATIHCDSNKAALVRLIDLGISPLLLSSGLSLLLSQRLVRRLCKYCKEPAKLSQNQIRDFQKIGLDYTNIFRAAGCKKCEGTGYFGRTAVCDVLAMTEQIKADINDSNVPITELTADGKIKIKSKLRKEGLKKVAVGLTSLEELKRVVG